MKSRIKKWVLVVIWMVIIFMFSSQNSDQSSKNNEFIVYILNLLGLDVNSIFNGNADFVIRKLAHFTEYFVLYFLLFNALKEDLYFKPSLLTAFIITFLYAVSDEFHQRFVPGRAPSFRDVLIDTSGGLVCMAIIYFRRYVSRHIK